MHAADQIDVELDDGMTVMVKQKPRDIPATRMGVGACLWEGELLLAAYLAAQPRHRYIGQRAVELGSGPGLAGLMLAKLGVQVVITDKDVVLPLIQENIELNGLPSTPGTSKHCGGSAVAEELEWGREGYMGRVAALASTPVDLVLAADVTYVDQDGQSPSTEHFVQTCKGLCGPQTVCLVSFELRSSQVKEVFLRESGREFSRVERLSKSALPKCYQVEHIELYKLQAVEAPSSQQLLELGERVRAEVPVLHQLVHGHDLVYLDNAATSQKPRAVLDAMNAYYEEYNSNVHRGVHSLSARATDAYEAARHKVAAFINAATDREIVFTRNASEAINLVAYTWGLNNLKAGDEIILSVAEHHSNLVPWQLVAERTGAVLKHIGLTAQQELDVEQLKSMVNSRTKLISLPHVSNTLGCVLDVPAVVAAARSVGAKVLLDACQSVPHMPVDVQTLGADWIVASSHKMMGPTGIGFLWGRYDLLESMPPWMGGGEMIQDVFLDHSTYAAPPMRFEAGTPAIAEAIGLGAACDYLSSIGMDTVHAYEDDIGTYLYNQLAAVPKVTIYGPPPTAPRGRAALAAFNVEGLHATDVSTLLDNAGVAVRSGHHCTQPLHRFLGVPASARASCSVYTTRADVDAFIAALKDTIAFFEEVGSM